MPRRRTNRCKCGKLKRYKHDLCRRCFIEDENHKVACEINKNRTKQENLLKNSQKLPAKNRKKGKIIDALLSGSPASSLQKRIPNPKPKTIRYRNPEDAITLSQILKDLEKL